MGCVWRLGAGPFEGGLVLDYFADPTDPGHVLAVAEPPALSGLMPAQLFESRDGGLDYGTILHPGVAAGGISGVEIARSDPRTIYVALFETSAADALTHPRLARTADAGVTWETIDLEPTLGASRVTIAAVDPNDAQRLYLRVAGTGADGRSVDSIAVSADGGVTFTRPVNLSGGKLMTFIARANGTVLVTGLLGATVVGYRSLDAGATFASWQPGLHPRGFGERGATLFVATDGAADGFALASSEDDGDTFTPRMRLADIEAIRELHAAGLPGRLLAEGHHRAVAARGVRRSGRWPTPGMPRGGGGGGCSAAGSADASPGAGFVAAIGALAVIGARLRSKRRRWRTTRGRAVAVALLALIAAPGAAQRLRQDEDPRRRPRGARRRAASPSRFTSTVSRASTQADVRAAVTAAAHAWSADANPCTSLTFALTFAGRCRAARRQRRRQRRSACDPTAGARTDTDAGTAVTVDAGPTCNAPSATAATSVFAASDGRIVGGDTAAQHADGRVGRARRAGKSRRQAGPSERAHPRDRPPDRPRSPVLERHRRPRRRRRGQRGARLLSGATGDHRRHDVPDDRSRRHLQARPVARSGPRAVRDLSGRPARDLRDARSVRMHRRARHGGHHAHRSVATLAGVARRRRGRCYQFASIAGEIGAKAVTSKSSPTTDRPFVR